MAAQPECRRCGAYVSHGPCHCDECTLYFEHRVKELLELLDKIESEAAIIAQTRAALHTELSLVCRKKSRMAHTGMALEAEGTGAAIIYAARMLRAALDGEE